MKKTITTEEFDGNGALTKRTVTVEEDQPMWTQPYHSPYPPYYVGDVITTPALSPGGVITYSGGTATSCSVQQSPGWTIWWAYPRCPGRTRSTSGSYKRIRSR